jgi:hypothetical protein
MTRGWTGRRSMVCGQSGLDTGAVDRGDYGADTLDCSGIESCTSSESTLSMLQFNR